MTKAEFERLAVGDIVRHVAGSEAYVVTANYGTYGVVMTRTQLVSNPPEWEKVVTRI